MKTKSSLRDIPVWGVVYILTLIFLPHRSFSQLADHVERKISYQGIVSGGVSRFKVFDLPDSPDYLSAEANVGLRLTKPIGKIFSLMSGLALGYKFKRDSYFEGPPTGPYTREPSVVLGLDDSASKKGAAYLSMPIALVINLNRRAVVYGGINGRFWIPRNHDYMDVLTGQTEVGIIAGVSHGISNRVTIGIELYSGLKDLYYGAVLLPSSTQYIDLRVTNQNLMVVVAYSMWVKK